MPEVGPVKYLPWVVSGLILLGAIWLSDRASTAVDEMAGRVEVLEEQQSAFVERARVDSVALDSVQTVSAAREAALVGQRLRARQGFAVAAQDAQEARGEVLAVLDSLGASHEALDHLEAAHRAEIAAIAVELTLADSTTAVVRGQLRATETALSSERGLRLAGERVNEALRGEVAALKMARRFDRLKGVGLLGVVLVAAATLR